MAAAQGKVIITCAVTGSIHTPSMSPYLPITPDEIAEAAIGAAKAGAAIVHLHARNPKDGSPTQDPNLFRQFAGSIKAASDVVLNFTTGGAPTMSTEERLQPALQLQPEVASLTMGPMNFGLYGMLGRYKDLKHTGDRPESLPPGCRPGQGGERRGAELHHRRRAHHVGRGGPAARAAAQARGRLAQHGVDELRPVRDARPLQGPEASLGTALPRGLRRAHLQEHLQGHRDDSGKLQGERHEIGR